MPFKFSLSGYIITKHLIIIKCLVFFLCFGYAYASDLSPQEKLISGFRFSSDLASSIEKSEIDTYGIIKSEIDTSQIVGPEVDSTNEQEQSDKSKDSVLQISDSTIMLDDSLTIDAEPEEKPDLPWTFDAGLSFKNQQVQNGVAMSNGKPVGSIDLGLSHSIGLSLSLGGSRSSDKKNPYSSSYIGLDYDLAITDWFDIGAGYIFNKYNSDTANVLAGANKTASLSADVSYKSFIMDLTYDYSYGTDTYNYISPTAIYSFKGWGFKFIPLASVTYSWYTIHAQRITNPKVLARLKKKYPKKYQELLKNNSTTLNESGLSSVLLSFGIKYPISKYFSVSLTPSYSYTPNEVLSNTKSQFLVTLGLSYSLDF